MKKRIFYKYYVNLYKSQKIDKVKLDNYLQRMTLPKLTEDMKNTLNGQRRKKVLKAINGIKLGEASGLDGLSAKFYTTF